MIRTENICKSYWMGKNELKVLKNVSFEIKQKEFVSIAGPSGSGKSTLMNIIGCLDIPTSGKYYLDGIDVSKMVASEQAEIRNKKIGFVFQSFNLLPKLTALENVMLPLIYRRVSEKEQRERARMALERVGLDDRRLHRPNELSGGQQQRVAIARAIAGNPPIILADEPTGNLDSRSGIEIMEILKNLNSKGTTLIMITHDEKNAQESDRIVTIMDGIIGEGASV
jgi:putative ABC transport system ATP-binding protein